MRLKSLTYSSRAQLDLSACDLVAIHESARHLNALDGITGLLIFNGTSFLQVIEGAETAIDALLERLRRDSRHTSLEVVDERVVDQRSFPDWSMEMVQVSAAHLEARDEIETVLPSGIAPEVRQLILNKARALPPVVLLPD